MCVARILFAVVVFSNKGKGYNVDHIQILLYLPVTYLLVLQLLTFLLEL